MQAAPKVSAAAETVSSGSYNAGDWMQAIVPGTVLTTMVARGIYPDPDYGLTTGTGRSFPLLQAKMGPILP
jgi:hypothetical protein